MHALYPEVVTANSLNVFNAAATHSEAHLEAAVQTRSAEVRHHFDHVPFASSRCVYLLTVQPQVTRRISDLRAQGDLQEKGRQGSSHSSFGGGRSSGGGGGRW
jgi:uncharacterized membrane protein YgcG